jgi:hypothetical protein
MRGGQRGILIFHLSHSSNQQLTAAAPGPSFHDAVPGTVYREMREVHADARVDCHAPCRQYTRAYIHPVISHK